MSDRIEILNQRQNQAVDSWIESEGVGTLNMATGTGKTITAFKCIYKVLDLGWIDKGCTIRFLAEVIARKFTLEEEIDKFEKITGKRIDEDFDIQFFCYAAVSENIGQSLDIYDEIHDSLTEKYHKNIKNSEAKFKIGLSATIPKNINVFRSKFEDDEEAYKRAIYQSDYDTTKGNITDFITKGQLAEILCPTVFSYGIEDAIKDGVLSPFKTYVINHHLDKSKKVHKIWKSYDTLGSEWQYYDSRDRKRKDWRLHKGVKRSFSMQMTRFLYNLPSKAEVVKAMLKMMNGQKTAIFGIELKLLRQITENVCEAHNTEELIKKFNSGEISVIASAQRLKQGVTLEGIENIIIVSYYSKPHHLEQIAGRLVRFVPDKVGKLFILRTRGTFEETRWFDEMRKIRDEKGKIIRNFDLNIQREIDSANILLKAKEHEIQSTTN